MQEWLQKYKTFLSEFLVQLNLSGGMLSLVIEISLIE